MQRPESHDVHPHRRRDQVPGDGVDPDREGHEAQGGEPREA